MTDTAEGSSVPARARARAASLGRRWRRTTIIAAWLAVAVVVFAFAARTFGWEAAPVPHLVALVPMLTFGIAFVALVAGAMRAWLPAVAAATLALVGAAWLAPLFTAEGGDGEPELVVATINLRFGLGDADEVVAMVRNNDVDILSVQELTPEARDALAAAGLDDVLPFSEAHPAPAFVGTGLWSRRAVSDGELVPGLLYNTVRATVDAPGGALTVYAVHPPRPEVHGSATWLREAAALREELATEPGAVLVAGDLNATRDQGPIRRLTESGFVGAVDQAGAGFLPTYPNARPKLPIVVIDHIMTRGTSLRAVAVHSESITGADHKALIVEYALA